MLVKASLGGSVQVVTTDSSSVVVTVLLLTGAVLPEEVLLLLGDLKQGVSVANLSQLLAITVC